MHGRTMHRDWHHHQISTDLVKALISGALLVPNTRSYLVFPMLLVLMEFSGSPTMAGFRR